MVSWFLTRFGSPLKWLALVALISSTTYSPALSAQDFSSSAQVGYPLAPPTPPTTPPPPAGGAGNAQQSAVEVPALHFDERGQAVVPSSPLDGLQFERPELGMTDEGRASKQKADSGAAAPTGKQPASLLQVADPLKSSIEPAPAARPPVAVGPLPNAPVLGDSWQSHTFDSVPPDPTLGVGPFQAVSATNGRLRIFNKNGTLVSSQGLSAFFGAGDGAFDPWVLFDPYINRFWVLAVSRNVTAPRSTIHVALSNTSDATDGWRLFATDARFDGGTLTNNWCDFPKIGFDAQAVYFTCNMFAFNGGFQYAKFRVMTKAQFLNNTCCSWWDFWDLNDFCFIFCAKSFSLQPANMQNAAAPDGMFLINAHGGGGGGSDLRVRRITNAQLCCFPMQTGPTLQEASRGVGGFGAPPNARQPFGVQSINTVDSRLQGAFWRSGFLTTWHGIAAAGSASIGFTEFNVSSYPTMTTQGDWFYGDSASDRYVPQVAQGPGFLKTMVFSRSSTGEFASAIYVGVNVASTGAEGPDTVLLSGQSTQLNLDQFNRNRWGDYSGAWPDPSGVGIWIHGEAASATTNQWVTQLGLTGRAGDRTPPSTTASPSPAPNAAGWNKGANVLVGLNATDNPGGSGVRWITRGATGAQFIPTANIAGPSTSVNITVEGITNVNYFARDDWGNDESPKSTQVKLDRTPPTTSFVLSPAPNANGWNNTNVNLTMNAADSLSGVKSISWGFGAPFCALTNSALGSTVTIPITFEGRTDVCFLGVDNADNASPARFLQVLIDKTMPTTTATPAGGTFNGPVSVTLNAVDALSGVESITYSATGAQPIPITTVPGSTTSFTISAGGTTTVSFLARDRAGNVEATKTAAYTIPSLTFSPPGLDFGNVPVGDTKELTLTVRNNTSGVVTISLVSIGGVDATEFALGLTDTCSFATLMPADTCGVSVVLSPSTAGLKIADLGISSDAPGSPHSAALRGNGTTPALTMTPSSLSFADQQVGTISAEQTITVRNTGAAPLNIVGVAIGGVDTLDFAIGLETCSGAILMPGDTCSVPISFGPTTADPKSASLDVSSNAPGNPHSAALSGTGFDAAPLRPRAAPTPVRR
jgi:hypothetical protein